MTQKFVAYTFAVTGQGHFPTDMLRYERCTFRGSDDAATALAEKGVRRVELIAFVPVGYGTWKPTLRWNSFGWSVEPESLKAVQG